MQLRMWWWLLAAVVVFVAICLLVVPRKDWNSGLESSRLPLNFKGSWKNNLVFFLPFPMIAFSGIFFEVLPTTLAIAVTFFAIAGSMFLSLRSAGSRTQQEATLLIRETLADTTPAYATSERLGVAAHHRPILEALLTIGAVDGIRVRVWKIAEITGQTNEQVKEEATELYRAGLVGVSTFDSGDDISRHLVDLTKVGVRVIEEAGLLRV
ncbi:hypothetical protein [Corynebacterium atrinae]|uniref:hypothetical protein n=1 Tax=Corynebacterium atrinae TaxID=1336740 RepID=UPI0025B30045|nr:hypothetical protein [Corynebacterium atrinae]